MINSKKKERNHANNFFVFPFYKINRQFALLWPLNVRQQREITLDELLIDDRNAQLVKSQKCLEFIENRIAPAALQKMMPV